MVLDERYAQEMIDEAVQTAENLTLLLLLSVNHKA